MKHLFFSFLVIGLVACKSNEQTNNKDTPLNIVIVFADDMGYGDLECYGAKGVRTPNLNLLAEQGARLTNFHVAQPVCSASRAALLTGCYPNRVSIHGALGPGSGRGLHPEEETLAELLMAKGYSTAIYGKWHLGDHPDFLPTKQGFDEYFGIPYSNDMWPMHPWQGSVFNFPDLPLYDGDKVIDTLIDQTMLTTQITERAVDFIERNSNNPFFLYVPHPQPHVPLFVSDKFRGKSEIGLYGDVIMELDWSVGQIMAALDNNGIAENTVVIFTSDNGPWLSYGSHAGSAGIFREGKGTNWEGGTREPFIIRYPEGIKPGQVIETPLMSIDILPSLANLTNAKLPEKKIDGKDAWKVLTGESSVSPQEAYFFYYHVNELQAVMMDNWKLILPQRYRTLNNREGGKDGLPVDYEYIELEQPELYNLSEDPSETKNVAEENPQKLSELMELANRMREKLGDRRVEIEGLENREPGRIE